MKYARGTLKITNDKDILKQLRNTENFLKPNFEIDNEGNIKIKTTQLIEIEDYTNKTKADLAILPVDVIMNFKSNLKSETNKPWNIKHHKTSFKLRKCQYVFNPRHGRDPEKVKSIE